jgi:tetratricopeptide (TPR) repeat protein
MARATKKKKDDDKAAGAKVISLYKDEQDIEKQTTLQQATAAEKNGDLELAEKLYRQEINKNAFNASVYTRLMVIYRKQKKYKEELEIINKALKHFKEHAEKQLSSKTSNAAIKKLSKSLNKSLGLTDRKGNFLYEPEPVPTWKKRKTTVEKKLKSK